jgi:TIR domain
MSTDIFLSYASEDSSKAAELARLLENDGWSVWWDRDASPAPDVEIDSARALSKARAVVVLWSVFSVSSNRVKNETGEAREANRLIPVLLEDARIPLSYRSMSTIDLRTWPDSQSLPEISRFRSAVSHLLHNGVPGQVQKKPATSDAMSLSVRVASHMALGRSGNGTESAAADSTLAVERCISDIFLDILKSLPDTVQSKVDGYIMQLAAILRAPAVICSKVNFLRMGVSDLRSMDKSKVTAAQEKVILEYVNQYCSPSGELNLHPSSGKWPERKMLCLPLSQHADGREFAWFISEAPIGEWTQATQNQLLKLASGIQAVVSRAS